ncbi:hypothetical protein GCM10007301_14190 [Azorhizobium oxalatiphilum]|uniref:Uncharacterized protein n=1 Tax=Azorhizobium oxalatiphilum TaxID=980631 RepID=A0A917BTG7_9HYPH|nr:hypothetical protein [Azorhizobium oxalatiphilum]GGF55702.1 hypothetical protein GCM10007301_14190 [Azorhizobium oxalatiphilum]
MGSMPGISESDVITAVGPASQLIIREILRTKASLREFRHALAFIAGSSNAEASAYGALSDRVQRLVDLLEAAPAVSAVSLAAAARHFAVRPHV